MAVEKKKSFLLYCDLKPQIDLLSYEDKGRLLEAIFDHECGGEVKQLPPMAQIVFKGMEAQLTRDRQRYEETCSKRAEAGKKGGLKSSQKRSKMKQKEANEADIDKEKEKEKEKEKDIEKDIEIDKDNDNDIDKETDPFAETRVVCNKMFFKAFGVRPSQMEEELLLSLYATVDEDIIEYAFEQAVFKNNKNLSYVLGVIKNLRSLGINNMGDMYEYDMKTGSF